MLLTALFLFSLVILAGAQDDPADPDYCTCLITGCGPFSYCRLCSCQACFHADSHVTTPKGERSISEVKPGDEVLVVDELGKPQFEPILFNAHSDVELEREFMRISARGNANLTISLTPEHYLYRRGGTDAVWGLAEAKHVTPGDLVLTMFGGDEASVSEVIAVSKQAMRGVQNPVTPSGRLVVDGVLASAYANDVQPLEPRHTHMMLWPVRVIAATFSAEDYLEVDQKVKMPRSLYWAEMARRWFMAKY